MAAPLPSSASYREKFALLNRNMRWEVADLLREANLSRVNAQSPLVTVKDSFYSRYGKRAFDVAVAAFALVVTLPINTAIALVTLFSLGRPVFFRQKRLGRNGKLFTLIKFRNMREVFDENGHPLPGHLRVTRVGRFLRKTSLDELLNFWSVLRGDMSVIGPRPLVPEYYGRFSERHKQRLAVRPGIECPPRSREQSIAGYGDQFDHDVWYVQNISFANDIRLLFQLFLAACDRDQARKRSKAAKGSFMGYDEHGHVVNSHEVPTWALDAVLRKHGLLADSDRSISPPSRSA